MSFHIHLYNPNYCPTTFQRGLPETCVSETKLKVYMFLKKTSLPLGFLPEVLGEGENLELSSEETMYAIFAQCFAQISLSNPKITEPELSN